MSTFLELCQTTAREVGIPGDGPVTTVGQTGQLRDIVRWVKDSYIEIQNRNGGHWRYLRHPFTLNTVSGTDAYSFGSAIDDDTGLAIDRFSEWRFADRDDPPRVYLTSSGIGGQIWMIYTVWDWFKQIFKIGTQNPGFPNYITVNTQDQIVVGYNPDDDYTLTGEYWRSAQILTADGDIPEMPTQFHKLIVWYAIENYGYLESAPEVIARAKEKKLTYMRQLERNQIERFRKSRPLA